jgi:hypothetical protein
LGADELVHLLLGLELGKLKTLNGIDALVTCQFLGLAVTHLFTESLKFLLVHSALLRLHEVDLGRLLEDLLGDLKSLVEVSLNKSLSELFPVCGVEDKLLELFFVASFDGGATLDSVLSKTILGLLNHILRDEFVGLEEVLEGHGAILLVFRLAKSGALCDKLINELLRRLGAIEFGLLFRLFLSDDKTAEGL